MWEEWDHELIIAFFTSSSGEGPDSQELQEAFYAGWVDNNNTADERVQARQEFFDIMEDMGYPDAENEFDWDDWRDWYDSQAA